MMAGGQHYRARSQVSLILHKCSPERSFLPRAVRGSRRESIRARSFLVRTQLDAAARGDFDALILRGKVRKRRSLKMVTRTGF